MPSQFYVAPAGDISAGLSGLSSVIRDIGEERKATEAAEAKALATEEAQSAVIQGMRSGDPQKMMELSVTYPEYREQLDASATSQTGIQNSERIDFMRSALANPAGIPALYQERIQDLRDRGRDPSHSIQSLEKFMENPEAQTKEMEMMFAYMAPEEFEALQSSRAPSDMDLVQIFPETGEPYTAHSDGQGNYFNLVGNPITPAVNDRISKGSLTGGVSELGLSQSSLEEMQSSEISTMNFADSVDEAIAMIDESPDLTTLTARGAAIVNNLQQEAAAIGRSFNVNIDQELLEPSAHEDAFDNLGIQSQRIRSLITSLAYARAAANNPDGRISNTDLNAAVSEIGGDAADPRAFKATLNDVLRRTIGNFENQYRVKTGEEYRGTLLNRVSNGASVEITTQEDYDALPSGAEYLENGRRFRKP